MGQKKHKKAHALRPSQPPSVDACALVAATDDDVWFGIEVFGLRREHMILGAKTIARTTPHTISVVNAVCVDPQTHPTSPTEFMIWPEEVGMAQRLAPLADFSTTTRELDATGHVRSTWRCPGGAGYLALVSQAQTLGIPVLLPNRVTVQPHAHPTFNE